MNLYFETTPYVGISSRDPRRGSHWNVWHVLVRYSRGKVKQSMQGSF